MADLPSLGGIDASIPLQVKPPVTYNPLEAYGQYARVQNELNQNTGFQQQQDFRKAIGPLLLGSADPETGRVDPEKLLRGLSGNPATAMFAQDEYTKALANKQTSTAIDKTAQEKSLALLDAINKQGSVLAARGDKVTPQDFGVVLGKLVAAGIPADYLVKQLSVLDMKQDKDLKYPGLQQAAQDMLTVTSDPTAIMKMLHPDWTPVQTGAGMQMQRIPTLGPVGSTPSMEVPAGGGFIPNSPTPEQRNALVPVQGPGGEVTQATREEVAPMVDGAGRPIGVQPTIGQPRPETTPSTEILKRNEANAAGWGDYQQEMSKKIAANRELIQQANQMAQAVSGPEGAEAGGLADLKTIAGRIAQGLGADPKMVNAISNSDIANSETFQKYVGPIVLSLIKQRVGTNGGKIGQFEYSNLIGTQLNLETDPHALETIMNSWKKLAAIDAQENAAWPRWRADPANKGKSVNEFQQDFTKDLEDSGLYDTSPTKDLKGTEVKPPEDSLGQRIVKGVEELPKKIIGTSPPKPIQGFLDRLKAKP